MNHYSKALLLRLLGLGLCLVFLLSIAMIWFGQITNSPSETSVFKPSLKISQLKMMNEVIQDTDSFTHSSSETQPSTIPCSSRAATVLQIRAMEFFSLDSNSAENFLKNINRKLSIKLNCNEWIEYIQTLGKFRNSNNISIQNNSKKETLDEALAERVSWNRRLPCVYYQHANQLGLAVGSPVQCLRDDLMLSQSAYETSPGMRKTIQLTKSTLANSRSESLSQVNQSELLLTLDTKLQKKLDEFENCLNHRDVCKSLENIPLLKHVSVVIMSPNSGDILATLCWAGPCERLKSYGNLGALLVETPPASTAKLLHAMVIAENGTVEPLMLERQIKTSGQVDGQVSKRNEWWEKQAICDGQTGACLHTKKLIPLAELLNWSANCNTTDIQCGRLSLIGNSETMIFPGFIGKIKTVDFNSAAKKLLSWKEYDDIRQGKKKSPGTTEYLNTALTVQSSIGAGDSRTSALGLAHLSGQIYQMSHGKPVNQPRLIKALNVNQKGQQPTRAQQKAAQTVIAGMRKVVEPIEPGWSGPGTASGAMQRAFKQPCIGDCGLWAKTGTVSQKDPGFRGATLLTGVIDLAQLSQWRYKSPVNSTLPKVSIGIIAYPQSSTNGIHIASELGMYLASELSSEGETR